MIPISQALAAVLEACPLLDAEVVSADISIGRVLRETITAPHDYPPFDRVMMDGFAVRAEDLTGEIDSLPLVGEAAAGAVSEAAVGIGTCVRVMTGAPLPQGADAVVQVEHTEETGGRVRFLKPVKRHQHFARRGEEAASGSVLLRDGEVITPSGVAVLASAGRSKVAVSRLPTFTTVSTGDEIVPIGDTPGPSQIRDTNSWSLSAQAYAEGIQSVRRMHARDDERELKTVLADALTDDIVVISGGVSAGKYDLVPGVLESLGVRRIFHMVSQKPGKPLWFGKKDGTLVFGAPGNPLATVITFDFYVRPAITRMTGKRAAPPTFVGILAADVVLRSDRELFAFVRAAWRNDGYEVVALKGRGSADVFAPATANALVHLPAGRHELRAGQAVRFRFLGPVPGD